MKMRKAIKDLLEKHKLQRRHPRALQSLRLLDKREKQIEYLSNEFTRLGLDSAVRLGNPLRDIGAALELVDKFGIDLSRGTCYGDCVAYLLKDKWKNQISELADEGCYIDFVRKPKEEMDAISAWSYCVPVAVCKCLVRARQAGVI